MLEIYPCSISRYRAAQKPGCSCSTARPRSPPWPRAADADDVLEALVRLAPGRPRDRARRPLGAGSPERARLLVRLGGAGRLPGRPEGFAPGARSQNSPPRIAARTRPSSRRGSPIRTTPHALLEAWRPGRSLGDCRAPAIDATDVPARVRRSIIRLAVASGDPTCSARRRDRRARRSVRLRGGRDERQRRRARAPGSAPRRRGDASRWRNLPPPGGPPWDELVSALRRRPAVDAPATHGIAAARAEIAGVEPPSIPPSSRSRPSGSSMPRVCSAFASTPAASAEALAAEVLVMAARAEGSRRCALARAPCRAVTNLATGAMARGPIDDVVRDVLANAARSLLRARVEVILRAEARPPVTARRSLPRVRGVRALPTGDTMLTIEKLFHLRAVPLFAGVALDQLAGSPRSRWSRRSPRRGDLSREGDVGDRLFRRALRAGRDPRSGSGDRPARSPGPV